MSERGRLVRWRLVLGESADESLGCALNAGEQAQDRALSFLSDRKGSLDPSQMNVPDWINQVHELFPKKTIERLEKDALERYQLQEMVTNPEVLQRAEPNQTLLKAILHTKHLMNAEVLA